MGENACKGALLKGKYVKEMPQRIDNICRRASMKGKYMKKHFEEGEEMVKRRLCGDKDCAEKPRMKGK